nr:hypothetical protein K-LCC10_0086 [Kaumoebavirus]
MAEYNFSGIVSKVDGQKITIEDCDTSIEAYLDKFPNHKRPLYYRVLRGKLLKYCDSRDREDKYCLPEKLVGCRVKGHLKLQKYNCYVNGMNYMGHKANIVSVRIE